MFNRVKWVFELELKPVEKLIFLALCSMANEQGDCYPRVELLAKYCGVCTRTIQRALKRFEANHWLVVTPRFRADGQQTSNNYRLSPPQTTQSDIKQAPDHPDNLSPPPRQIVTPGVTQLCQGGGDTAMSPQEVHTEESINYVVRKQVVDKSVTPPRLVWTEDDLRTAKQLLKAMAPDTRDALFAEVNEAMRKPGVIKTTPIRYLRGLISKHQKGEFNPYYSKNKIKNINSNKTINKSEYQTSIADILKKYIHLT
ncbi:helix-turn-helix domain-containing protein [Comamonas sp. CMM02]|nr:helix-turn-helix domain-containing protein [Comamonas sp. CMM02]